MYKPLPLLLLLPLAAPTPTPTSTTTCPPSQFWTISGFELYFPAPNAQNNQYFIGFGVTADPQGYVYDPSGFGEHGCQRQSASGVANNQFSGCYNTDGTTFFDWDGLRLTMEQNVTCGTVTKTVKGSKIVNYSKCHVAGTGPDAINEGGDDGEICNSVIDPFNIFVGEQV